MRPASPLTAIAFLAPLAPALAQGSYQALCTPRIQDASQPGACVVASSIPMPGALLPLGPELFVDPAGRVGLGTMAPAHSLDVHGDGIVRGGFGAGNDAQIGLDGNWNVVFDLSHTISDFSSAQSWAPFRSVMRCDPQMDLRGADARYIYGTDCFYTTALGNDKDIEYFQGPYMLALHNGTGTLGILEGAFIGSENNHGHAELQGGVYVTSIVDWEATTEVNAAGEFISGHWGTTGWIEDDYSVYIYSPLNDAPLTNHYGLYIEDQVFGEEDSYAIYSENGPCYFGGDVGIRTDTPSAALDVNGDFVASGTKSFVEPHPTDPNREIRFVCLEGNEAGTYFRGTTRVVGGEVIVDVPEDFRLVTEAEGLTVQVTPIGELALTCVASSDLNQIVIRADRDVEVSYLVNGVRRGYAEFETMRERDNGESNASKRPSLDSRRATNRARISEQLRRKEGPEPR